MIKSEKNLEIRERMREYVNFYSANVFTVFGKDDVGEHARSAAFTDMLEKINADDFNFQEFVEDLESKVGEAEEWVATVRQSAIANGQAEYFIGAYLVDTPEYYAARSTMNTYRFVLKRCYNRFSKYLK